MSARNDSFHRNSRSPYSSSDEPTSMVAIIVAAIFGLAAAAAVILLPNLSGVAKDEGHTFANRVRAARDAAIVADQPVGVWVTRDGYAFQERIAGRWTPMNEQALRAAHWRPGVQAVAPDPIKPRRIIFDGTGAAFGPQAVSLMENGVVVQITVSADGTVRVDD